MNRREVWLSAATALWGVAIAVSLVPLVLRPAPAGQLPSYATRINMDAHSPLRFVILLIAIPILLPLVLRPLIRLLARDDSQPWSAAVAAWSCVAALWFVIITRSAAWVILVPSIVWGFAVVLRRREAGFSRDDVILIPTFATVWLAISDRDLPVDKATLVAALVVLMVRIAVTFITPHPPFGHLLPAPRGEGHSTCSPSRAPRPAERGEGGRRPGEGLPPAFAFTLAPLGLVLQTSLLGAFWRASWPSLLIAVISPFVLRPLLSNKRAALRLIAFVVYPLAVFSYSNASSLMAGERLPRVNFFEHGHGLMPASEMLRGERPYRDILLAHGLLEDGGFDYAMMRVRGVSAGSALGAREFVVTIGAVSIYALAATVSASPHVGILAYFLSVTFGAGVGLRALPAVVALTLAIVAVRRGDTRWLAASAIAVGVSFITSLDFAAYAAACLLVAAIRFTPNRRRAMVMTAIGATSAAAVLAVVLATAGILRDFVAGTFGEVLGLTSVYALDIFAVPAGMKQFAHIPEIAVAFLEKSSHLYVVWLIALLFVAVVLPRRRSRAVEALFLVAVFIVVSAISYAERRHLHFQSVSSAFLVPGVWMMFRRRWALAPAAALLLVMIGGPTLHTAITSWLRVSAGPVDPKLTEILTIPRARGALFHANDVASIEAVREYLQTSLPANETFFDFTNRGAFYFLFNRNCPVRQYEVPYYQRLEQQREVISRIDRNPNVRAVLVPREPGAFAIDGVPNKERAPLVWQYIETHFRPDFERGDVVFWRRVESGP